MKLIHVWILVGVPVVASCATSYVPWGQHLEPVDSGPTRTVYVVNPELGAEMAILEQSGLYELTRDPTHPLKLTLSRMETRRAEGMPYLISLFTLGLWPISLHDVTIFSYSIEGPEGVTEYEHVAAVEERYSIWQRIHRSSRLSQEQALAKSVAISASLKSAAADSATWSN